VSTRNTLLAPREPCPGVAGKLCLAMLLRKGAGCPTLALLDPGAGWLLRCLALALSLKPYEGLRAPKRSWGTPQLRLS